MPHLIAEHIITDATKRIPWGLIKPPPDTPLADLTGRLVCQRCGKNGPLPLIAGVACQLDRR
jgi:hypothetical protein